MEPPDVDYGFDYGYNYGDGYCDGYDHQTGKECDPGAEYDSMLLESDMTEFYGHEYGYPRHKSKEDEEEFDKMWPTVEQICRSLMSNPHDWVQDNYTIVHKPTKACYWTGSGNGPIVESFGGGNNARIFSDKQGTMIRAALGDRFKYVPSHAQLAAMKAFGTEPKPFVPEPGFWGNLWVAIKFLPTMARFFMRYNK